MVEMTRQLAIDIGSGRAIAVTVDSNSGILYNLHQYRLTVDSIDDVSSLSVNSLSVNSLSVNGPPVQASQTFRQRNAELLLTNIGYPLRSFLARVAQPSFNIYIYFLRHFHFYRTNVNLLSKHLHISHRSVFKDCLTIYSLTEDRNFFDFIRHQLLLLWTVLSPALYSLDPEDGVVRELCLHLPYQLLPEWYYSQDSFMAAWLANQDNKHVVINGDEIFDYDRELTGFNEETEDYLLFKGNIYRRGHDNLVIRQGHETSSGGDSLISRYNDKVEGKIVVRDNQDVEEFYTIDGMVNGPTVVLHNGRLMESYYHLDNKADGLQIEYFPNSQSIHNEFMASGGHKLGHQLEWWPVTEGHGSNGSQPALRSDTLWPTIVTKWTTGLPLQITLYTTKGLKGSYLVYDYDNDRMARADDKQAIATASFYDAEDRLVRVVTQPFRRQAIKHDYHYDVNGNIISDREYGPGWTLQVSDDQPAVADTVATAIAASQYSTNTVGFLTDWQR